MKKVIILIIIFLEAISFINVSYATNEIISSQMETLNISSLIKEGEYYTRDVFPDLNLQDFFNSALQGNIDNKSIISSIISLFGDEILSTATLLREYFNNSSYT